MAEKQSKVEKLLGDIGELTVVELSELVSALQEKFGVSPQMAAPAGQAAGEVAGTEASKRPEESKTAVTVVLTDSGANKIAVIKALREIKPELGLKEAKDITEATPKEILADVKMDQANAAREKLEAAGAKVEMK